MTKWTEVNVYTGRPVDEDAPANFGGAGSGVDMNPTGMKKKKSRWMDYCYCSQRRLFEAGRQSTTELLFSRNMTADLLWASRLHVLIHCGALN